ncbi:ketopantoate reductase family protein [Piscinibacter sp.]|uniref:ketopantoate reductase family protein n=1 Tax=Piscinibacter sp. TaxID=1903157 RepID=UPI0039E2A282
MNDPTSFHHIAVVGAGAVGSWFGAMLARAGHPVVLIGRAAHVEAIRRGGLRLESGAGSEIVAIGADTDIAAVRGAELVLVCVKSPDTEAAARAMAPHLKPGALVLSLQNGVDNAATIARHVAADVAVVPAVVYVATALPAPGTVAHHGRGDLVIGSPDAALQPRLRAVAELFIAAQVPVAVRADVMAELWRKLMLNCAYNAISAIAQQPYGRMAARAEIRALMRAAVEEVVAVARADGQPLVLDECVQAMERLGDAMPAQMSSTAQDLARGKPSEIDHLNGFVARRGEALGVATPVNRALHALVKLIESARTP